jgi:hypothetical protein
LRRDAQVWVQTLTGLQLARAIAGFLTAERIVALKFYAALKQSAEVSLQTLV